MNQQNINKQPTLESFENEITLAKRAKDNVRLTKAYDDIVIFLYRRSKNDEAIRYLDINMELQKQLGKMLKYAEVILLRGKLYNRMGNFEMAFSDIDEAYAIYKQMNHLEGISNALITRGAINRFRGNHTEALNCFMEAMEYFERLREKGMLVKGSSCFIDYGSTFESLGVIYGILNQVDKSREHLTKAIEIMKEAGHDIGIIQGLNNLGVSYSQEDPRKTLEYYQEALHYAERINDHTMITVLTNNIGGVYEDLEDYPQALKQYLQAQKLCHKFKFTRYLPVFHKHIGTVYKKIKDFEHAERHLNQSLKLALEIGEKDTIQESYKLLSEISELQEDYSKALDLYKQYVGYREETFSKDLTDKLTSLQQKFEQTNRELQETRKHNSLISDALKRSMKMNFIGCSQAIRQVLDLAMTAASHPETSVLITGESGTGKEIIAHIIHYASKRKDYLIVPVNCSAIPDGLVESEFFGHVKGAFTGAITEKTGYIEEANSGTLFLDEIADTPPALQAKFLRVLENKRVKKVGSNQEIQIDFRLIAATNKDITRLIKDNIFRADLLYRINTIEIHIPPLRERKDDIEPLLQFYIEDYARILRKPTPNYSPLLLEKLKAYHFPGNVRELRNMVEKAMIMLKGDTLEPELFNLECAPAAEAEVQGTFFGTMEEMEKRLILEALRRTDNNQTNAAKLLGISYSTIQRKLRGIDTSNLS